MKPDWCIASSPFPTRGQLDLPIWNTEPLTAGLVLPLAPLPGANVPENHLHNLL